MTQKVENLLRRIENWYDNLKWYWKILFFVPFIVVLLFLLIFWSPNKFLKTKSSEPLKEYIEDQIKEKNQQKQIVREKIKTENIRQEEIKDEISAIEKGMEKQIEEIASLRNPTPDDFDKLFNSFRNRN